MQQAWLRAWIGASSWLALACASSPSTVQSPTSVGGPGESSPVTAAQADSESNDKAAPPTVVGQEVTYEVDGTPFVGYVAYDSAVTGPRPGVLVVHEWWGHNEYARMRARQLAAIGYTALALDMYGEGKQATHPTQADELSSAVFADLDAAEQRFRAAYELLAKHESTNAEDISAIGYCFGGGIALNMARRGISLDGVASFHGSLSAPVPAEPGAIKAKILVLTGEKDPMVPAEQVEAFSKEMERAGVTTEIHSYPGALHAFTNPMATELGQKYELPIAYDAQADAQSWQKLTEFLAELYPDVQRAPVP